MSIWLCVASAQPDLAGHLNENDKFTQDGQKDVETPKVGGSANGPVRIHYVPAQVESGEDNFQQLNVRNGLTK